MENKKRYELQDYYDVIRPALSENVKMSILKNKLGQDTLRIHCQVNRIKTFDMFIFNEGFAVAYKPNGRTKVYEYITPRQAKQIAKISIEWWLGI